MPLIFTNRRGVVTSSFIKDSKSVPPARTSTSPQVEPSSADTCSLPLGLEYSNGRIAASFRIESGQHSVWRNRQKRHAHANGIGNCVGNRRHRPYSTRLAQADGAAPVISFAGNHWYHPLAN